MARDTGQTEHDPERTDWWRLVEDHLAVLSLESGAEGGESAPWSDTEPAAPALTAEQRAFLAGDDQPGVPRITHPEHAPDDQPPVPRFGATAPPGSTTGNIPGDAPDDLS
jgi:hypothetical protein